MRQAVLMAFEERVADVMPLWALDVHAILKIGRSDKFVCAVGCAVMSGERVEHVLLSCRNRSKDRAAPRALRVDDEPSRVIFDVLAS